MNREIKFRAWLKEKKEMREVAMLRWENGEMVRIAGYWPGTRDNGWTDYSPKDEKYILMQYTGLKDKNGKEIYEGDILKWMEDIYYVEWQRNGLCAIWNKNKNQRHDDFEEFEVIGNIYENPELVTKRE